VSATTTQLLSSGEFCKLRYDTMPVKSSSVQVTEICQILGCDTFFANERYIYIYSVPTPGVWSLGQQTFVMRRLIFSTRFLQFKEIRIGSHTTSRQCQISVRFTCNFRLLRDFWKICGTVDRSQWPRGLRLRSAAARLLRL